MVYLTVKHGANEETLFNQDCRCVTLLSAIREKCCEDDSKKDVIELSDKEGNVKDLRKYPNMTAKEVIGDREDCILIKVGVNEKGRLVYTPLLENEEIVTKAFLDKLAKGSKRAEAAGKGSSSKAQSGAGRSGTHHGHHHHHNPANSSASSMTGRKTGIGSAHSSSSSAHMGGKIRR